MCAANLFRHYACIVCVRLGAEAGEHLSITHRVDTDRGSGYRCLVPFTRHTSDLGSEPYRYGWNIGTPTSWLGS